MFWLAVAFIIVAAWAGGVLFSHAVEENDKGLGTLSLLWEVIVWVMACLILG